MLLSHIQNPGLKILATSTVQTSVSASSVEHICYSIWVPPTCTMVGKGLPRQEIEQMYSLSFVFSYSQELQYDSACCPTLKNSFLIYFVWFYNYIWRNASTVPFIPSWPKVERILKNSFTTVLPIKKTSEIAFFLIPWGRADEPRTKDVLSLWFKFHFILSS